MAKSLKKYINANRKTDTTGSGRIMTVIKKDISTNRKNKGRIITLGKRFDNNYLDVVYIVKISFEDGSTMNGNWFSLEDALEEYNEIKKRTSSKWLKIV